MSHFSCPIRPALAAGTIADSPIAGAANAEDTKLENVDLSVLLDDQLRVVGAIYLGDESAANERKSAPRAHRSGQHCPEQPAVLYAAGKGPKRSQTQSVNTGHEHREQSDCRVRRILLCLR